VDKSEFLALTIVAIAAAVYVRGFFKKSKSKCCPSACDLKPKVSELPKQNPSSRHS